VLKRDEPEETLRTDPANPPPMFPAIKSIERHDCGEDVLLSPDAHPPEARQDGQGIKDRRQHAALRIERATRRRSIRSSRLGTTSTTFAAGSGGAVAAAAASAASRVADKPVLQDPSDRGTGNDQSRYSGITSLMLPLARTAPRNHVEDLPPSSRESVAAANGDSGRRPVPRPYLTLRRHCSAASSAGVCGGAGQCPASRSRNLPPVLAVRGTFLMKRKRQRRPSNSTITARQQARHRTRSIRPDLCLSSSNGDDGPAQTNATQRAGFRVSPLPTTTGLACWLSALPLPSGRAGKGVRVAPVARCRYGEGPAVGGPRRC
jgi:hypothetical protein